MTILCVPNSLDIICTEFARHLYRIRSTFVPNSLDIICTDVARHLYRIRSNLCVDLTINPADNFEGLKTQCCKSQYPGVRPSRCRAGFLPLIVKQADHLFLNISNPVISVETLLLGLLARGVEEVLQDSVPGDKSSTSNPAPEPRCRENWAHVRQSGPNFGPGFQVKLLPIIRLAFW